MPYAMAGIGTSVPYDQMEIGGDFNVKWVICFNDNNDERQCIRDQSTLGIQFEESRS